MTQSKAEEAGGQGGDGNGLRDYAGAFKADFRFWVLALKPLDGAHFALFGVYLPLFLAFSLLALRGFGASLGIAGEGWIAALVTGALAFSLGFVVLLGAQYLNMAAFDGLRAKTDPIISKGFGGEDQRRQMAVKRLDVREIIGTKTMREITLK